MMTWSMSGAVAATLDDQQMLLRLWDVFLLKRSDFDTAADKEEEMGDADGAVARRTRTKIEKKHMHAAHAAWAEAFEASKGPEKIAWGRYKVIFIA